MFFNYIEKNINKKQKIMKEKRRFSKSIATFGLLLILFFICFLLGGCSQTNNKRLERDSDREFDNGSGIYFYSISEEKTSDLAKLCKVWGLAKYYHPEVVSGNINWDYELFRVMPRVLEEGADVNSILYQWIHSFDSGISIGSKERQYQIPQDIIQLRPSTDWCRDEKYLGEDLSLELSKLLDTNIIDRENAYVSFKDDSPYPFMENENPYPDMKFDDTGFRLLGLFRYWNIIEYYYPYKDVIEEDWDQVLLEFIPKFVQGSDYESYLMTISELTTKIHDSHAVVEDKRRETISTRFGLYRFPVNFVIIDNKVVISKVIKKCGLEPGDIVLKVGDKDIEEILDNRRKYISQSREDTGGLIYYDLFRTNEKSADVTVIRNGKTLVVNAKASQKRITVSVDTRTQAMEGGKIYYINGSLLKAGEIERTVNKWWNTQGLIVDLRNYPSKEIAFKLAEYLIPTKKEFFIASIPNREVPGEFYYTVPYVSGKPDETDNRTLKDGVYKGKLVIIINERTISRGETTAMSLKNTPGSVVLGRPSAGANGDVRRFTLPGKISTTISGFGIFYPDKTPTQRIGIQPDIYVEPTIEGIKEGRDEYIEKAIEIILNDR
jgi:C-terminal processing protease CtpA/Prc